MLLRLWTVHSILVTATTVLRLFDRAMMIGVSVGLTPQGIERTLPTTMPNKGAFVPSTVSTRTIPILHESDISRRLARVARVAVLRFKTAVVITKMCRTVEGSLDHMVIGGIR